MPGIVSVSRANGFHALSLADETRPQAILARLAACREIEHFEVVRPTLHDIFVDIAGRPNPERATT